MEYLHWQTHLGWGFASVRVWTVGFWGCDRWRLFGKLFVAVYSSRENILGWRVWDRLRSYSRRQSDTSTGYNFASFCLLINSLNKVPLSQPSTILADPSLPLLSQRALQTLTTLPKKVPSLIPYRNSFSTSRNSSSVLAVDSPQPTKFFPILERQKAQPSLSTCLYRPVFTIWDRMRCRVDRWRAGIGSLIAYAKRDRIWVLSGYWARFFFRNQRIQNQLIAYWNLTPFCFCRTSRLIISGFKSGMQTSFGMPQQPITSQKSSNDFKQQVESSLLIIVTPKSTTPPAWSTPVSNPTTKFLPEASLFLVTPLTQSMHKVSPQRKQLQRMLSVQRKTTFVLPFSWIARQISSGCWERRSSRVSALQRVQWLSSRASSIAKGNRPISLVKVQKWVLGSYQIFRLLAICRTLRTFSLDSGFSINCRKYSCFIYMPILSKGTLSLPSISTTQSPSFIQSSLISAVLGLQTAHCPTTSLIALQSPQGSILPPSLKIISFIFFLQRWARSPCKILAISLASLTIGIRRFRSFMYKWSVPNLQGRTVMQVDFRFRRIRFGAEPSPLGRTGNRLNFFMKMQISFSRSYWSRVQELSTHSVKLNCLRSYSIVSYPSQFCTPKFHLLFRIAQSGLTGLPRTLNAFFLDRQWAQKSGNSPMKPQI